MIAHHKKYENISVSLDGGTFVGCEFTRCRMIFSGLLPVTLEGGRFSECQWEFSGPAAQAIGFMAAIYAQGGGGAELIEKTFENIRKNATGQARPGDSVTLN